MADDFEDDQMSDLHLGQHISRRFNEELEEVRSKVLHMGGIVEGQLANALRVLVNDEIALAKDVVSADSIVNSLEVDIDEDTLREIASKTGGQYFRAEDMKSLQDIYETIDKLEKNEVKVKSYAEYRNLYIYFLLPALACLMLWAILGNTRYLRIP